jgi:hypothetical protein
MFYVCLMAYVRLPDLGMFCSLKGTTNAYIMYLRCKPELLSLLHVVFEVILKPFA